MVVSLGQRSTTASIRSVWLRAQILLREDEDDVDASTGQVGWRCDARWPRAFTELYPWWLGEDEQSEQEGDMVSSSSTGKRREFLSPLAKDVEVCCRSVSGGGTGTHRTGSSMAFAARA